MAASDTLSSEIAKQNAGSSGRRSDAIAKIRERREAAIANLSEGSRILDGTSWRDLRDDTAREDFLSRGRWTGLALSGGGIRSATISLGLIEALASRGRFYGFDLMSTVSGGGYCGSFVRSLFVGRNGSDDVVRDAARAEFADATLSSLPDQQFFRSDASDFMADKKSIKNPLWWLRENGRYLAPGGMSAYGYALSYIVRNWLTLLIYLLAVMMVAFAVLQVGLLAFRETANRTSPLWKDVLKVLQETGLLSPLWPMLAFATVVGAGIAAAYWLSIPLPFSRPGKDEKADKSRVAVVVLVLLLVGLMGATIALLATDRVPPNAVANTWAYGLLVVLASGLASAALTWVRLARSARSKRHARSASRVDFRREQTQLLARYNALWLVLLVATLIDWGALWLRDALEDDGALASAGLLSSALASITSFLVAKLPDWLGGKRSKFSNFLVTHARRAAFVAAIVILASVALLADMLVLKLLWRDTAWAVGSTVEWDMFGAVIGLVALAVLLFGSSLNFVNLLGLTPFYGSRLTRAYLGASNALRLDTEDRSEVTQGLPGDDIALDDYMRGGGPAPLHLINVTRNRTVGDEPIRDHIDVRHDDPLVREDLGDPRGRLPSYESSLTLHDRHGDRVVFGPFGVRVGAEFFPMEHLKAKPSLGLLCAISGAAVGSGMGRMTSLGTAMALTLANVRLGYWWRAQRHVRGRKALKAPWWKRLYKLSTIMGAFDRRTARGDPPLARSRGRDLLPGLSCLYNELLGRFSTKRYWHLSDGGHSENSGALTLLERGCQFILVADNAQDPEYTFSDLEIFIRTARTDIGMEVSVVSRRQFPKSLQAVKNCFFNGGSENWRECASKDDNEAFALLLKAKDIPIRGADGSWKPRYSGEAWIVWLKPNRFADLPADLLAYAELHPDYPQQSTANQFFDEAQWESYRRLGFEMGARLFAEPGILADFLPIIYRNVAPRPSGNQPVAGTKR